MRMIHLADLHLGRVMFGRSLIEDQREMLEQILKKIEERKPNVIMLCGDIYDKSVPSQEAVTLFDDFLTRLSKMKPQVEILIIAGNHDSAQRLQFAAELLEQSHIHIAGSLPQKTDEYLKRVTLTDQWGEVEFVLLPYLRPAFLRTLFDAEISSTDQALRAVLKRENLGSEKRRVLLTHQFYTWNGKAPLTSDSEVLNLGGIDNVDVSAVEEFDYVAMGHIHGPQKLKKETIRYAGSPLKYSLSEANHHKSMPCIDLKEKGNIHIELIPLLPVHDVQTLEGSLEEILHQTKIPHDAYVSVILNDKTEFFDIHQLLLKQYPRLLEVKRKLPEEFLEEEIQAGQLTSDPIEIFTQFYEQLYHETMSEEETKLLNEIFSAAEKEVSGL